ncbi:MAG: hypothetical protein PHF98_04310 [Patescibacteria group bacterium]|nr:hypothetical protein [Patescibacteria group bacterium]
MSRKCAEAPATELSTAIGGAFGGNSLIEEFGTALNLGLSNLSSVFDRVGFRDPRREQLLLEVGMMAIAYHAAVNDVQDNYLPCGMVVSQHVPTLTVATLESTIDAVLDVANSLSRSDVGIAACTSHFALHVSLAIQMSIA